MRILSLCAALFVAAFGSAQAAEVVPATAYLPVLAYDAAPDTRPQLVPLAASRPLDVNHAGLTRAIIIIHDEGRDATGAMATIAALAGEQNAKAIILAPQFLMPSDIVRFADYLPEKGKGFAAWQVLGWSRGDESMPVSGYRSVSSFTVVDLLLMYLADRNAYPDLKEIIVAGHGAGANFIQRYAAVSVAADAVDKQNINLRFIAAGATSYLYQTVLRPLKDDKGFGAVDVKACPEFNVYPYGLEKLNAYARRTGVNAIKVEYARRFITYLNAEVPDPVPDVSCAALEQGMTGASRAENYKLYLRKLYGDVASRTQTFAKAKEKKNDAVSLFGSACGMATLFGDGLCR
ncbi:MAG: hypothetical protein WC464_09310 [Bdellovibrionales bacterium]